jgi:hypothetical protein
MSLNVGGRRCEVVYRMGSYGKKMPAGNPVLIDKKAAPIATLHQGQIAVNKERDNMPHRAAKRNESGQ